MCPKGSVDGWGGGGRGSDISFLVLTRIEVLSVDSVKLLLQTEMKKA